jgi:hypothetical protein
MSPHSAWVSIASGAVDPVFSSPSDQTKDYKIGNCCFSAEHPALIIKSKDLLARNQGNACPSVGTCLSTNRCFTRGDGNPGSTEPEAMETQDI